MQTYTLLSTSTWRASAHLRFFLIVGSGASGGTGDEAVETWMRSTFQELGIVRSKEMCPLHKWG